jgi:serine/threonine-protein kinase HipA
MKIGKRATLADLDAKAWAAFATEAGLGLRLIHRRVAEIGEKVRSAAREIAGDLTRPGFDATALEDFAGLVRDRAERCELTIRK